MTPTWLLVFFAIGSVIAFAYFTSDLLVLLRGPGAVPPTILRLAQAGDRQIAKGSLPRIAMTASAAAFFVVVPALWLALRRSDTEPLGQLALAGGLVGEGLWAAALPRFVSRGARK